MVESLQYNLVIFLIHNHDLIHIISIYDQTYSFVWSGSYRGSRKYLRDVVICSADIFIQKGDRYEKLDKQRNRRKSF